MRDIRLLDAPFEPGVLVDAFGAENRGAGAHCIFIGNVRGEGEVQALELSHYEPLTLSGMEAFADEAFARFALLGLLIVHRVGRMVPGEPIVCVSAAALHRRDAFEAVDFAMDHLKSAAWFWKRELRGGEWRWVEPRPEDHADIARWK